MRMWGVLLLAGAWMGMAAPASAAFISFECVTNTSAANCATGEAQLSVEVTDPGGGNVAFTIMNQALVNPVPSVVRAIYFDDGSLGPLVQILDNPPLTDFEETFPGPQDLPGGENADPPFMTSVGLLAGATSPPPNDGIGIDPGEFVTLIYSLQFGQTVLGLEAELTAGTLRAGLHVIAFPDGGSEGFVSVPEPASAALLLLAAAALARRRSRR